MSFGGIDFGYAAGTRGTILITEDGGETWTPNIWASQTISPKNPPPETILQAAFGDRQHGVIRTLSALLATTNAGLTWRKIVPSNDPAWQDKFPVTVGLAALDKDHLAVRVSAGPNRDGEYLWTSDGGSNWSTTYIGNSEIDSLFACNGIYLSVGHSILARPPARRDRFGAGDSAPMTFHSLNGALWETNPLNWEACHWHDCSACTQQGCFAGKSSFLDFHQPGQAGMLISRTDQSANFPAHKTLSSQWARIGNTLCLLTRAQIECSTLQPVTDLDTPQFESPEEQATFEDNSIAPMGKIPQANPQCIRCQLDPVYLTHSAPSGAINIQVLFTVEPTGTITHVEIGGNLPPEIRDKIQTQAEHWLFEPTFKDDIPNSVSLTVTRPILLRNLTQPAPLPNQRPSPVP